MTKNKLTIEEINYMLGLQNTVRDIVQKHNLQDCFYAEIKEKNLYICLEELNKELRNPENSYRDKQEMMIHIDQVEGFIDLYKSVQSLGFDTTGLNGLEVILQASKKPITVWNRPSGALADWFRKLM